MPAAYESLQAVIDSIDAIIYVADMKTYELLLINNYTRRLFGDIQGGKCWASLQQGQTGPCDFCSNSKLVGADGMPLDTYVWEFQNTVNGRWYECRDKAISWTDGRIVRIEIASDVTGRKLAELKLMDALTEAKRFREALDNVSAYIYMKDPQSRYVYANRPTLKLFGCSAEELTGCDDTLFFPPDTVNRLREVDLRVLEGEQTAEEIDVADAGTGRRIYWEIKTPIYAESGRGTIWGLLGISTDITERKRMEEEREKLIADLREALEKVKTLSGLLPICSFCKKIRDDKGYWNQLEIYIHKHSEAEFSHGICPDCVKKFYPEHYDKIIGQDNREPEVNRNDDE